MASIGATINIYDGFSSTLEKLKCGLGSAKQSMNGLKSSFKDGMNGNIQSPLESAGQQAGKTGRIFKSMLGANIIDRKSTRLNSSHVSISYAVFCLIKNNRYR